MRRRHLRGVMSIERRVYPRPWSPTLFLSELTDEHTRAYFVAKVKRELVGYAGVNCWGDEAHVTTVAVAPEWQRCKIGSRLFYEIVRAAVVMGARAISLEVRISNEGAQHLYESFGFRPIGVRKNYYQEVNEDALVMWVDDVHLPGYADRIRAIAGALPDEVAP
jgi:ribosomal-protein-alanine N-acetyltransferase